ncbi:hypothetical protein GCM10009603_16560 [Nocardiopsis exhalans]
MAKTRRARAKRARAPERFLRPSKLEDRLAHVRAFLEVRGEPYEANHIALVNAVHHYGPEIWPDDIEVRAEHAEDIAVLAAYREAL